MSIPRALHVLEMAPSMKSAILSLRDDIADPVVEDLLPL